MKSCALAFALLSTAGTAQSLSLAELACGAACAVSSFAWACTKSTCTCQNEEEAEKKHSLVSRNTGFLALLSGAAAALPGIGNLGGKHGFYDYSSNYANAGVIGAIGSAATCVAATGAFIYKHAACTDDSNKVKKYYFVKNSGRIALLSAATTVLSSFYWIGFSMGREQGEFWS